MSHYEALVYPGDVTGSDHAQPGAILGCDEFGRPYAVIDAEFYSGADTFDEFVAGCPTCGWRVNPHTHVHLEYATPDQIRAAVTS